MTEIVRFCIPVALNAELSSKNKDVAKWIYESLALGCLLQMGNIYQKINDEYIKLGLLDFPLYPDENDYVDQTKVNYIGMKPQTLWIKNAQKMKIPLKDWALRAISFRNVSDNLQLFYLDDGKYVPIDTKEEFVD